jgi:hypothetical protein
VDDTATIAPKQRAARKKKAATDPIAEIDAMVQTIHDSQQHSASGIPVHCSFDRIVDLIEVIPHPRNPNKHPEKQIQLLAKIIKHQGWRAPIVVSKLSGFIVAGHGRYTAARLLNVDSVPVNFQAFATQADEYAHMIADNRIAELAELQDDLLRELMRDLKTDHFDLELTGFGESFLEKLNQIDAQQTIAGANGPQTAEELSSDLGGAKALKSDMLFESKAPFGMPEIRKEMCMAIPKNLETFAGWENIGDHTKPEDTWLYIWATDVLRGLDFHKAIVGFYCDDYRFECFWENPSIYTAKLLNAGVLGALGPDFSTWSNYPTVVKMWQCYRQRWVTRYFQECGIKTIPSIDDSSCTALDFCFAGVPKNLPAVSVQIQTGRKTVDEIVQIRKSLLAIIDALLPDQLLLYVGMNYEPILENLFPPSLDLVVLRNRLTRRAESIKENTRQLKKTSAANRG